MKKHFLIFLLAVSPFFAAAQSEEVVIPPDVADYFLFQDDRVKLLDSLVIVKDQRLETFEKRIHNDSLIIKSHEADSTTFAAIIAAKDKQYKLKEADEQFAIRELRKQRRQKYVIVGGGIGAFGGSFFGPAGTVAGTAVGAGTGFVIGLLKRRV